MLTKNWFQEKSKKEMEVDSDVEVPVQQMWVWTRDELIEIKDQRSIRKDQRSNNNCRSMPNDSTLPLTLAARAYVCIYLEIKINCLLISDHRGRVQMWWTSNRREMRNELKRQEACDSLTLILALLPIKFPVTAFVWKWDSKSALDAHDNALDRWWTVQCSQIRLATHQSNFIAWDHYTRIGQCFDGLQWSCHEDSNEKPEGREDDGRALIVNTLWGSVIEFYNEEPIISSIFLTRSYWVIKMSNQLGILILNPDVVLMRKFLSSLPICDSPG